jgi:hypothetical protein
MGLSRVEVKDNILYEPETGWKGLGDSISLFFACSPDVSRQSYTKVVDSLVANGINMARFAGSTYTWDNAAKMANVIPFRKGSYYVPEKGRDKGYGVKPELDPDHAQELIWRLGYARDAGLRVQYTILWGGTKALFTSRDGEELHMDKIRVYIKDVARLLSDFPEHTIEICNEINHGHHFARIGEANRKLLIARCAEWIRHVHRKAVITVSDGGHEHNRFNYTGVNGLDHWNVHFDRSKVKAQKIPRWCRGSWHLWERRHEWRDAYGRNGYGRSDENIFLCTEEEKDRYYSHYGGLTTDWKMYGIMRWITAMAGVGFTIHNFPGFYCKENVTQDPIFQMIRVFNEVTEGFNWHNAVPMNSGWNDSPIGDLNKAFKAYTITGGKSTLFTILNPNEALLEINPPHECTIRIHDPISGEVLLQGDVNAGEQRLRLPTAQYKHCLVGRMYYGKVPTPTPPKPVPPPTPPPPPPPEPTNPREGLSFDHLIHAAYNLVFPWRKGKGADPGGLRNYNDQMRKGLTYYGLIEKLIMSAEYAENHEE